MWNNVFENFGENRSRYTDFQTKKTTKPIGGSNRSSLKTNTAEGE